MIKEVIATNGIEETFLSTMKYAQIVQRRIVDNAQLVPYFT